LQDVFCSPYSSKRALGPTKPHAINTGALFGDKAAEAWC